MQLIGMLDSPYVRRVAISLRMLALPFEHRPVSVFRHFDEFSRVNPVVKAPTLVCDDGTVLMDSSLILDYAENISAVGRTLMPLEPGERCKVLHVMGLALAACEKSISIVYERELRPVEKQHDLWVARVTGQLHAACAALEDDLARRPLEARPGLMLQDGVTAAVAWSFMQLLVPDVVAAARYPRWREFTAAAEKLEEFVALPQQ